MPEKRFPVRNFCTLTMPRGFDRERTSVDKLQYHFIWCRKYRESVLRPGQAYFSAGLCRLR